MLIVRCRSRRAACLCWQRSQHVFESQKKLRREPGNIDAECESCSLEEAPPQRVSPDPSPYLAEPPWRPSRRPRLGRLYSLIQAMLGAKRRPIVPEAKTPVFA